MALAMAVPSIFSADIIDEVEENNLSPAALYISLGSDALQGTFMREESPKEWRLLCLHMR
jgi:hypothetical protein